MDHHQHHCPSSIIILIIIIIIIIKGLERKLAALLVFIPALAPRRYSAVLPVGFAGTLADGITAVHQTTSVARRSPGWQRAARRKRRKRARARVLLKESWPTAPARIMAGAARLHFHHGSTIPAAFNQSWVCHACEEANPMMDAACQRCGHAAGFQKPPPGGMWRSGK